LSDILSQSEIEALLSSLVEPQAADANGGSLSQAAPSTGTAANFKGTGLGSHRAAVAYEVYDFRRPDKFSKEQLRTLQMLHETFARFASTALSAYLRSTISIDLISLEQVPYEEYLRSINQSVFTIMSLPPLNGQAALELEFGLVFTMIDKLLGGPGRSLDRNVLTDIEQPLFRQIVERMFMALKSAWEGVVIVNPSMEALETSAQFVQIAPPTDIVVSILFEVRVGEAHGAMSLCVPYMVLKPITAKLSAQKWFAAASNRKQTVANRRALVGQINATSVDCTVRLGKCRLSVHDFLRLRRGDTLRLDQKTERDLQLLVSDNPKYFLRPGLDGKKLAFEVTAPISPNE